MSALQARCDAVDAFAAKAIPRPGSWRREVNLTSKSVALGTRAHEAISFARWGMGSAQPLFPVRSDRVTILHEASDLLAPIPGREHHKWARRIDNPNAEYVETACNSAALFAGVVREAAKRPWWQNVAEVSWRSCRACGAHWQPGQGNPKHRTTQPHGRLCWLADLDAAVDRGEAEAGS